MCLRFGLAPSGLDLLQELTGESRLLWIVSLQNKVAYLEKNPAACLGQETWMKLLRNTAMVHGWQKKGAVPIPETTQEEFKTAHPFKPGFKPSQRRRVSPHPLKPVAAFLQNPDLLPKKPPSRKTST